MKAQLATIAIIIAALPAVAHADEWSHTQEFAGAQTASIRVVEPEGYKVTINGRTDTVPAVFPVDNVANYYAARFESPEGATWEKKIEVKEYRQTILKIRHVKAAAAASKKVRTFVGVAVNLTHTCKKLAERVAIRLDFVLDGTVVKSVTLESRSRQDLELPEGQYAVRRYKPLNGQWGLDGSDPFAVTKDTWIYEYGCRK